MAEPLDREADDDGPAVPLVVLAGARKPAIKRLRRQNLAWLLGFAVLLLVTIFLPAQVPDVTVFNETWFALVGATFGFVLTGYFAVKSARNPAAKLRPRRRAVLGNRRPAGPSPQRVQSWAVVIACTIIAWFVAPWMVVFFVAAATGSLALGLLRLFVCQRLFGAASLDPQVFGYYIGHPNDPMFQAPEAISSDEVLMELPDVTPLRRVSPSQWPFLPVQPTAGSFRRRLQRLTFAVTVGIPIVTTCVVWLGYLLGDSFRYWRDFTYVPATLGFLLLAAFLWTLRRRQIQRRQEAALGYTTILVGLYESEAAEESTSS